MSDSKACSQCKQTLLLKEFGIQKQAKDGHRSICKTCRNAKARLSYVNNKDYWVKYRELNPEKIRIIGQEWYKKNKFKKLAAEKARRLLNPEYYLEKGRRHRENNRALYINYYHSRKQLLINVKKYEIKKVELEKLLAKPCIYCGGNSEHIDHIIPISRGGQHSIGNLIGACAKCNTSKGSKLIMEWKIWKAKLYQ